MITIKRILVVLVFGIIGSAAQAQSCGPFSYTLTNGTTADANQVMGNFNTLLNCINSQPGLVLPPMGRLTLASGTPVMTVPVTAASSVIYTPAVGNLVPLWNGTGFSAITFSEVSQALSDTTKSPSAAVASNVYDLFAWSDGGTFRVTRGPAWSAGTGGSNTVRGTGAGSTALTRVSGILVNQYAITNGPAAGYGTYVGTIATDSTGATVTWNLGSSAAGGGAATLNVWNMYNRVDTVTNVNDSASMHTYTSATIRAFDASNNNRVTFVTGLAEDGIVSNFNCSMTLGGAGNNPFFGLGVDTTSAYSVYSNKSTFFAGAGYQTTSSSTLAISALLGSHYIQALESSDGTYTVTYSAGAFMLFTVKIRM